jgi:hypothetical protein
VPATRTTCTGATVSLSVELESCGKIANQVKGNLLTVGTRFTD